MKADSISCKTSQNRFALVIAYVSSLESRFCRYCGFAVVIGAFDEHLHNINQLLYFANSISLQWYAPIKIIGIKIIVPIKSEKSLRLMVHISKTLTKSLR
jgi:hypothetical protein